MPILYHFTCRGNIEGIFRDGTIRPGGVVISPYEVRPDYAVCLTSDTESAGQGLPDGREVTPEQAARLKTVSVIGNRLFSVDHTKYRIKIQVPDNDANLLHVPTLLSEWPLLLDAMEIGGYFPCSATQLSNAELCAQRHLLQIGSLKGKSQSWWYYCGNIPVKWFIRIDVKAREGVLLSNTPEQFQRLLAEQSRER